MKAVSKILFQLSTKYCLDLRVELWPLGANSAPACIMMLDVMTLGALSPFPLETNQPLQQNATVESK